MVTWHKNTLCDNVLYDEWWRDTRRSSVTTPYMTSGDVTQEYALWQRPIWRVVTWHKTTLCDNALYDKWWRDTRIRSVTTSYMTSGDVTQDEALWQRPIWRVVTWHKNTLCDNVLYYEWWRDTRRRSVTTSWWLAQVLFPARICSEQAPLTRFIETKHPFNTEPGMHNEGVPLHSRSGGNSRIFRIQ